MNSIEERNYHIKVLEDLLLYYESLNKCEGYYDRSLSDKIYSISYAIGSIKTDLKYDLIYENEDIDLSSAVKIHKIKHILDNRYGRHYADIVKDIINIIEESSEDSDSDKIDVICDIAEIDDIGDLSDGYHTFNQLYYQRMVLFATIVKQNKELAWKSFKHEDGELCFGGGWFIVGIDTPEGPYTYHYENKYYDMFDCKELPVSKHFDGHTEKNVTRLLSL